MSKDKIPSLRDQINEIDGQLIELLAKRRKVSLGVIRVKNESQSPVRDQKREEDLLVKRIQQAKELGIDAHYITNIFHEILDDSVRLQQDYVQSSANKSGGEPEVLRIAFQGIQGAYSHLAAQKFFARTQARLDFLGLLTFDEVIKAVEDGRADHGMLPVENTTSGAINEVYDVLLHTRLSIVGEEKFHVQHCLVAAGDVPPSSIRRVYSHPQAVAQCRQYLNTLTDCKVEYFTDTAMSVSKIKEDGDPTQAAIASNQAAEMFGLKVIRRDIATQKENYTRFLIAAREPRVVDPRIPCKTSLVMATGQETGSLAESLLVFRSYGINLSKLESRPIIGNPWEEMFYIDFEGNIVEPRVKDALKELTKTSRFLKILGSYPSQNLPRTKLSAQAISSAGSRPSASSSDPKSEKNHLAIDASLASNNDLRRVSRSHKNADTVIKIRDVKIGGDHFAVIAGPTTIESRDHIMACAREVKERGGQILRGDCFRPRTSPNGVDGLGFRGLEYLAEAGAVYGLPVVTEVVSPEDVERVALKADILQIGARNMQNFRLLSEVGRLHRPVLLKRGPSASLDDLLEAAESILTEGNQQIILCERGIRTFETAYRSTLDINAIAVLRARTHLPIVVDPCRAAGQQGLIAPLALTAKPIGAHGVLIDLAAKCGRTPGTDGYVLDFETFGDLVAQLLKE